MPLGDAHLRSVRPERIVDRGKGDAIREARVGPGQGVRGGFRERVTAFEATHAPLGPAHAYVYIMWVESREWT